MRTFIIEGTPLKETTLVMDNGNSLTFTPGVPVTVVVVADNDTELVDNDRSTCKNCGAWIGLHEYETYRCPKNGQEALEGKMQEWQDTVYE